MLEGIATAWVRAAYRRRVAVLLLAFAVSVPSVTYVSRNLGINTDTADMISASLPWRQRYIAYNEQFPQFSGSLAVVVDAVTPDLADLAAGELLRALQARRDLFRSVDWLRGAPFFRRSALMYLDADERRRVIDDLVAAQPLLGRLQRDPGLVTVVELLRDMVEAPGDRVPPDLLDRFAGAMAEAVDATLDGRFHRLSWRGVMAGSDGALKGDATLRVIRAHPVLDYTRLFPAEEAQAVIREESRRLGLVPERGVRVRITGGLAMSEEELRSLSTGAAQSALLALLGVAVVLALGLGSLRLVLITLVTLVAGLNWTAAFAAAAVGHLNMISVAFAVLYIGLGVDYAVHYLLRYRELLGAGSEHVAALEGAARDVGGALALCAVTTGVGFFAFLPTRFVGVSELGLIAGVGMFISLATTLTLLPALLSVIRLRPGAGTTAVALPFGRGLDRVGRRHGRAVRHAAALLALVCAGIASSAQFDANPLNLRDAGGEAVSTYRELIADGDNWSLDVLVADEAAADALAARLQSLPAVRDVVRLSGFVPADQDVALEQLEELALLLGPALATAPGEPSAAVRALPALQGLALVLPQATDAPGVRRLARAVASLLTRLQNAMPDRRRDLLRAVQASVTGTLAAELARLGDALDGDRITPAALPAELRRDWLSGDGRLRLRIDAREDLNQHDALVRFVEQVREVAPDAVGTPIVHLESARVVVDAFIQAFALALVCIALILYLVLRRAADVFMVLAPLVLAALVTVAVLVLLQVPFNFANVIALPLLLGVGVDSGIHMLGRARLAGLDGALSASGTARGVVTSALTTTVSFGNLAFSGHPGTASMGVVLSVGMVCVLVSTLLVMPALAVRFLHREPVAAR